MPRQPFSNSYRVSNYISAIVLFAIAIAAMFVITYVLAIIAIVGGIAITLHFIKQRFFSKPTVIQTQQQRYRVIEHEDD